MSEAVKVEINEELVKDARMFGMNFDNMFVPWSTFERIFRRQIGRYFGNVRRWGSHEKHAMEKEQAMALICALYVLQYQMLDSNVKAKSGAVFMCGDIVRNGFAPWGRKFLEFLGENDRTCKMFKYWKGGKVMPASYKIITHHNVELKRLSPELNEGVYNRVVNGIGYFFNYIKNHRSELPEHMQEFADNLYKYRIDMKEASLVCKNLYGMSFEEAKEVLGSADAVHRNEKFMLAQRAYQDYGLCRVFNEGAYCVTYSYNRMYSPFQRLKSDYRVCIYGRGEHEHERIAEKCDMSGAFVTTTEYFMAMFAMAQGKKKLYDALIKIVANTTDPYGFAVDEEHERKAVKGAVVSTLFASPAQIKARLRLNERFGSEEVIKSARAVVDFYNKNKHIAYLPVRELNRVCDALRDDVSILKAMYPDMKIGNRITFTAQTGTKMYTCKVNFAEYINLCQRIVSGYWTKYVKDCIIKSYGQEVWDMFAFVNKLSTEYSNSRVRLRQNLNRLLNKGTKARVYYKKDFAKGNVVNISTICQWIEGEAMFKDILPNLKFNTDCNGLVSLHDSVWGYESVNCSGYLSNRTMKEAVHRACLKFMKGKMFKNLFKFWTNGYSMKDRTTGEWIDVSRPAFSA